MSTRPKRAAAQKRKPAVVNSSEEESDIEIKPKRSRKRVVQDDESFNCEPTKTKEKKVEASSAEPKKKRAKKSDKEGTAALNEHCEGDTLDGNIIPKSTKRSNGTKPIKQKVAQTTIPSTTQSTGGWSDTELLSNLQHIDLQTSSNVIKLFEDDNTIPFICRYRKDMIGSIDADQLRDIKVTYQHIQNIRSRAQTIIKDLTKRDLLANNIQNEIESARSLDELDHLYAPFKPESKSTLAERAKALGLQEVAEVILRNPLANMRLLSYVNESVDGLETIDKILEGIKHIISHIFSKDIKVLETIREILNQPINGIKIQTAASTKSTKTTEKSKLTKTGNATKKNQKSVDASKFQTYFDFQLNVNQIQSHQVLAINRGENLKVLTVKIAIPDRVQFELNKCIRNIYFNQNQSSKERLDLLNSALDEAYNKKLKPLMTRQIRSSLTKTAEKVSVEIFAKNLKQLLLLHPVKGKKILGIDPGFRNGCKLALISECMDLIETAVIYPHTNPSNQSSYGYQLADMMSKHGCDLIALGNGTACRETETWLTGLLGKGVLSSSTVRYCIISENGASIYSCGDVAKKEFPNLDVNLVSAVSIARRLSDPLAELVKVEPKHLGVGMYQHDVNEKLLLDSLNEIVMECVSFVGVDLNTASVALLKHIAGLNATRAENILKYRMENGPFKSRDELKKVKSIGDKTFTQCAGFVRIEPLTANVTKYNLLDSTWVHPESYRTAEKIMKNLNLPTKEIGSTSFIAKIKEFSGNEDSLSALGKEFKVPAERIQSVLSALSRELLKDYRDDADIKPLFKQGLQKMSDLKQGTIVTGAISNITTFGCFVDIGIECAGLIHVSKLNGKNPNIGDRVKTRVLNVDLIRKRVQLQLEEIL